MGRTSCGSPTLCRRFTRKAATKSGFSMRCSWPSRGDEGDNGTHHLATIWRSGLAIIRGLVLAHGVGLVGPGDPGPWSEVRYDFDYALKGFVGNFASKASKATSFCCAQVYRQSQRSGYWLVITPTKPVSTTSTAGISSTAAGFDGVRYRPNSASIFRCRNRAGSVGSRIHRSSSSHADSSTRNPNAGKWPNFRRCPPRNHSLTRCPSPCATW